MLGLDQQSAAVGLVDGERAATSDGPGRTTFAFELTALLWLATVIGGAMLLNRHATTPGPQTDAPARWPVASRIGLSSSGATLLVFVHPHCPCTRATLGQLAEIMATCRDRVTAYALFVVPDGDDSNWAHNELWQTADAIPGVHAVVDAKAVEAARFGAQTSGLTLLFNQQGACLFSGGITAARGHAGDNAGQESIVSSLSQGRPETCRAPTFGCPLFTDRADVAIEETR
jgi:hypothetical protein